MTMNDEQLIELVRNYPVLYDLSHPKYMDNSFKVAIWTKIQKEMKVTSSAACKCRWNNIRDNYRKYLKKSVARSSLTGKKIKQYKYCHQLRFINNYFVEKETKISSNSQNDEEDDVDEHGDEGENKEEDEAGVTPLEIYYTKSDDSQSQSLPSPKRDNTFEGSGKAGTRKSVKETPLQFVNQPATTSSGIHPVDAFLAGIAPTLKTFTPYYLNLAKSEIFATVQQYEMKMLMGQYLLHEKRSTSTSLQNVTPDAAPSTTVGRSTPPQEQTTTIAEDQEENNTKAFFVELHSNFAK